MPAPPPARSGTKAFVYDSDERYTSTLVPLLAGAVEAGDTVIAVVPRHNAALLRSATDWPAVVEVIDAESWYEHPVETIVAYERVLRELSPGTRAFVIGEVQFGVTEADWVAWTRYEAALNKALRRYDARALLPTVIADARRSHPHVIVGRAHQPSADYVDAATLFASLAPTVELPTTPPEVDIRVADDLPAARRRRCDALADR